MRDRRFVFTWWAGVVRDSFGPASVFRVARIGRLRCCRRADDLTRQTVGGGESSAADVVMTEGVIGMTLPDYWTAISAQMSTFMEWSSVQNPVALIVGTAVVCVMLVLFLGVFQHH